jgi:hypothetical protein
VTGRGGPRGSGQVKAPDLLDVFFNFYPNLFCNKTLHVSGNFFVHHQESRTVHFFCNIT